MNTNTFHCKTAADGSKSPTHVCLEHGYGLRTRALREVLVNVQITCNSIA